MDLWWILFSMGMIFSGSSLVILARMPRNPVPPDPRRNFKVFFWVGLLGAAMMTASALLLFFETLKQSGLFSTI
ncbi:MAG: hypothetical protein A3J46_02105 [Candidatus Yanofskybacteria bacterium RIFCSPHIGHO2_02_FULL_41_11]|uniref:Uncharacterized protein n=1 Tax=Candidatus Yanofskybacteria bacterium RIFCSPHIGHO2_02_FULL_41_11 TaxID=1802675 RepID=A0A1F8FDQ1_9BACT|nr:MAG: hypothetical protein A3J46_02105 [Candidatus Yanofskybacteria bacterium RIFCSPHIGHO2_02_FULL_41_11]